MDNAKYEAKRVWKQVSTFPLDKEIDVVATKEDKIVVKTMRYGKAINIPKARGWRYQYFQIGYHTYKNTK